MNKQLVKVTPVTIHMGTYRHNIFQTREKEVVPIAPSGSCRSAAGWQQNRHTKYSTTRLYNTLPIQQRSADWLQIRLRHTFCHQKPGGVKLEKRLVPRRKSPPYDRWRKETHSAQPTCSRRAGDSPTQSPITASPDQWELSSWCGVVEELRQHFWKHRPFSPWRWAGVA